MMSPAYCIQISQLFQKRNYCSTASCQHFRLWFKSWEYANISKKNISHDKSRSFFC